jgi:hypothetical protein
MDNVSGNMHKWCAKHVSEWATYRGLDTVFVSSHFDRLRKS